MLRTRDSRSEAQFKIALGKRLAQLRKERGLTQARLGQLVGISVPFVSQVEIGLYVPSILTLRAWATQGLRVPLDRVFRGLR